jgi:MerR family redox-sensitive transcriptional activator SoxR
MSPPPRSQPNPPALLTIGQLSRRSGVATSALRFYEECGLLRPERNRSGYRVYPRANLRLVAFIVFAQRIGLSLGEIAEHLAGLPGDRVPSRAEWDRLAPTWKARIDERIAELQRLRESLSECIGCGCLSLDRCPLSNPGDRAAARGPGPRRWLGDTPRRP